MNVTFMCGFQGLKTRKAIPCRKCVLGKLGSIFIILIQAFSLYLLHTGPILTSAGELMKVDFRAPGRMVNYYVAISLATEQLEPVRALEIDEMSVKKGHNNVTVITDLERKKVVALSTGKSGEEVGRRLKIMRKRGAQPGNVKKVALDLSPAYTNAAL